MIYIKDTYISNKNYSHFFKLKAEEINNEMNKKLDKIINEQKNLINFVFNPVVV